MIVKPIPVYVLPRVPGATETTEWITFCRSKHPFVVVGHDPTRSTSRWQSVSRKKPFSVTVYHNGRVGIASYNHGWFKTFDEAKASAEKTAKVQAELFETHRRERAEREAAAKQRETMVDVRLSKREVTAAVNALLLARDKYRDGGDPELSKFMGSVAKKLMEKQQ